MIVAVLFSGFVVGGVLALSVDVGGAMVERRVVQNGADAAAMALAQACAKGQASCAPSATGPLELLAGDNAKVGFSDDGMTSVAYVCAHGPTNFDECVDGSYADWNECLPAAANVKAAKYVEVKTRTKTASGSILPKVFSRMLAGGGNDMTVRACARAVWGPPGSTGKTLPLTIGLCDWMNRTGNGASYAPPPPYSSTPSVSSPPDVPSEVSPYVTGVFAHDNGDHKCSGSPGQAYPGGFGWLNDGVDCSSVISDGATVPGDTGNSAPDSCKALLKTYLGTEVFIPVFDTVTGTGANSVFHMSGIASFYLAGFANVPSAQPDKTASVYKQPSGVCLSNCNGSTNVYVWGWFTSGLKSVDASEVGSGPDRGIIIVAPAG